MYEYSLKTVLYTYTYTYTFKYNVPIIMFTKLILTHYTSSIKSVVQMLSIGYWYSRTLSTIKYYQLTCI